jgi:phosphoribosylformylglycinamidine synthase
MRIFVEKKPGFRVEADGLAAEVRTALGCQGLSGIRVFNRYDTLSKNDLSGYIYGVFAEINQDDVHGELPEGAGPFVFAAALLPGQFDQRTESAIQCLALMGAEEGVKALHAKAYALCGSITPEEAKAIQDYIVNPVDMRIVDPAGPPVFDEPYPEPAGRREIPSLASIAGEGLRAFLGEWQLAMGEGDLALVRDYFLSQGRSATETELKVLDAYWSDHCRHTTFHTSLSVEGGEGNPFLARAYEKLLRAFAALEGEGGQEGEGRPLTLMEAALAAQRLNRMRGLLGDIEDTEENNACSYILKAASGGVEKEFLLMFKNETHNHPTEIEPFGGAATCIGGAIRDPLSGRGHVYQSMRVTGAGDVKAPASSALPGKLPQRKITREAARGYSSYGNQFGLATGLVREWHHPGFLAKRFECGAVIASALRENVVRGNPRKGDLVYVVGGRTGRDGIGGASGSSKAHDSLSVANAAGEVQKGNAPTERKLERLFSNPSASRLILRSNDFGAGGVSVAIGEIAPSVDIFLDTLLTKHSGMGATELALSESQERMAVLIAPECEEEFLRLAKGEALEASRTAVVTDIGRVRMFYRGEAVFDLERAFLDLNGAPRAAKAALPAWKEPSESRISALSFGEALMEMAQNPNCASQRGMGEMFDSTIGAGSILLPYGGSAQKTPSDVMAHRIPQADARASLMAHGYDPCLASESAFAGARSAVVSSIAKICAAGGDYRRAKLSLQEYFARPQSPEKWGSVLSALLGAFEVQEALGVSALGGKDSMSGSYGDLDVPPTLVSFAVCDCDADSVVPNALSRPGQKVWLFRPPFEAPGIVSLEGFRAMLDALLPFCERGEIECAMAVGYGGALEAAAKMCAGEGLGFAFGEELGTPELSKAGYGAIAASFREKVAPAQAPLDGMGEIRAALYGEEPKESEGGGLPMGLREWAVPLGETIEAPYFKKGGESVSVESFLSAWEGHFQSVFPTSAPYAPAPPPTYNWEGAAPAGGRGFGAPRVLIPAFSGTNCENDTASAFERAGAKTEVFVFSSLSASDARESARALARALSRCQILALPGGFSAADEPDGSAKYIAAALQNEWVREALAELCQGREGLVLGICNGFQALMKAGLLPDAAMPLGPSSPTLTFNSVGRHISKVARVRVSSNLSPWLSNTKPGDVWLTPISHGEGRFAASEETLRSLAARGQIAQQYCGPEGAVGNSAEANPNGSAGSVEALTDVTGRILGKMGHSERIGRYLYKNLPGDYDEGIFEAGVRYFL